MATKGRIEVLGINKDGTYTVRPIGPGDAQLLAAASWQSDGLHIAAAWPRRPGGRPYKTLKLADGGPRKAGN